MRVWVAFYKRKKEEEEKKDGNDDELYAGIEIMLVLRSVLPGCRCWLRARSRFTFNVSEE